MDETTPHLHLNLIPIVDNKLSAKQLFTRSSLRELQTDFHEKVGKKWNLERGKEGSQAKHIDTAEFKAKTIIERAEARAKTTKANAGREASEYLSGIREKVEGQANKPTPRKRKDAEQEIVSLRTQNAANEELLKIKTADADDLYRQLQEAKRKDDARDKAFTMVTDMMTAFPDEFDALLAKARQKKNSGGYRPFVKSNHSGKDGK